MDQLFPAARRLSEVLGLTQNGLADLAGIDRSALVAKSSDEKVRTALGPIVQIITIAAGMAGDERRAAIWFKHQPIPDWSDKTAFDLVREGSASQVLDCLEAVQAGVYS